MAANELALRDRPLANGRCHLVGRATEPLRVAHLPNPRDGNGARRLPVRRLRSAKHRDTISNSAPSALHLYRRLSTGGIMELCKEHTRPLTTVDKTNATTSS